MALLANDRLMLRVGFGGCGPDHPFTLFAGADFMESNPVRTWARLQAENVRAVIIDPAVIETREVAAHAGEHFRDAHLDWLGKSIGDTGEILEHQPNGLRRGIVG